MSHTEEAQERLARKEAGEAQGGRMDSEGPRRTSKGVCVGQIRGRIAPGGFEARVEWDQVFREVFLFRRCDYRKWIGGHPMEAGDLQGRDCRVLADVDGTLAEAEGPAQRYSGSKDQLYQPGEMDWVGAGNYYTTENALGLEPRGLNSVTIFLLPTFLDFLKSLHLS